jgi:hypothetical protein
MPYSFDLYDYTGYIVPGGVLLLGLALFFPWIKEQFGYPKVGLGEIGSFIIIAFVLGHLLHGLCHVTVERFMRCVGWAMHTNKVLDWKADYPSQLDHQNLAKKVQDAFHVTIPGVPTSASANAPASAPVSASDWDALVRRMYVAVSAAKRNDRVDTFNRVYGLHLGLATAFGVILAMYAVACYLAYRGKLGWRWTNNFPIVIMNRDKFNWCHVSMFAAALLMIFFISIYRINEFSDFYAHELFAAFMSLDSPIQD